MSSGVVMITGALTGIGRATAIAFAGGGSRVVVSGRDPDKGAALAAELHQLGAEAEFIEADVRNEDQVLHLVERTVERFGRLDMAVNAAGTEGKRAEITDQTAENYTATFDSNVLGTLLAMKYELRAMIAQRAGSIVNISSTLGHGGGKGAAVYAASKHAVEGLTRSAALEAAAFGVRVNAVAPGPIDTAMLERFTGSPERKAAAAGGVPLGRIGRPEEIARIILFLSAEAASFLTGQIVTADGGKTAG